MGKGHLTVGARRLACVAAVARGPGHAEFLTDGTMVNTREGWQELRVSIFSKREPGEPRDPVAFTGLEDRHLPRPTACLVLARKRPSHQVGARWERTLGRLGWGKGRGVSAIADGARWIAAEEEKALPQAERVVDVYHVSQHLHACGAALHGEQTEAARAWARGRLVQLVRERPAVLLWSLRRQAESEARPPAREALEKLLGYPRPNEYALRYGDRLRRGQPIGGGQVEGPCKTIIGRRLKLNSARWLPANTEPIAAPYCLDHSGLWDTYWTARAA